MRKRFTAVAVGAMALVSPFVTAGSAVADVPAFDAKVLGPVLIDRDDPSVAHVRAQYVCDDAETWHLWVSLKQNEDGTHDEALEGEGSGGGQVADTWLQSHPVDFVCDGKVHVQSFTIDTLEQGYGEATDGVGWVQFCLIDFADESFQRAAIIQEWRSVR